MPIMIKKLGTEGGPKGQDKMVAPNPPLTRKKPRKSSLSKNEATRKMTGKRKAGSYKKGGKMELPKRKPRHANPNHPMNSERTTGFFIAM